MSLFLLHCSLVEEQEEQEEQNKKEVWWLKCAHRFLEAHKETPMKNMKKKEVNRRAQKWREIWLKGLKRVAECVVFLDMETANLFLI